MIEAVQAEEALRDAAHRAFVNIARRMQAIVHQQAYDIRDMEHKHGNNPDVFGDLLHLDHGNALTGRLADSIAVLGGSRPGRQWRSEIPPSTTCCAARCRASSNTVGWTCTRWRTSPSSAPPWSP
ncbi:hypothetical protein GCM10020000_69600 [Streptomyces olivoverticillatus]